WMLVRLSETWRRGQFHPPPGTPGEASGSSDCPRAGGGEGLCRRKLKGTLTLDSVSRIPVPPLPEYRARGQERKRGQLRNLPDSDVPEFHPPRVPLGPVGLQADHALLEPFLRRIWIGVIDDLDAVQLHLEVCPLRQDAELVPVELLADRVLL